MIFPALAWLHDRMGFDYSWTGLGRFSGAAVDALEVGPFHLVVHGIGGPVGFELAAATPDRILSLTIMNTIIEVESASSVDDGAIRSSLDEL